MVSQVAASMVALRRTRRQYSPQRGQAALMRVPRLPAHTRASTGAQPLRIETWGVSRMTASVPGRPDPMSGYPWRTKRPGAQSGLTALAAGDASSTISGSRTRRGMVAPPRPWSGR